MGKEDERVFVYANEEFDVFGELIVGGVGGHLFGNRFLCALFLGIWLVSVSGNGMQFVHVPDSQNGR